VTVTILKLELLCHPTVTAYAKYISKISTSVAESCEAIQHEHFSARKNSERCVSALLPLKLFGNRKIQVLPFSWQSLDINDNF
jgi:hypothetical protein